MGKSEVGRGHCGGAGMSAKGNVGLIWNGEMSEIQGWWRKAVCTKILGSPGILGNIKCML